MEPFVAGLRSASGSDPMTIVFEALALLTHSSNASSTTAISSSRNPDTSILKAAVIGQHAESVVTSTVKSVFWEAWWNSKHAARYLASTTVDADDDNSTLLCQNQMARAILSHLKYGPPVTTATNKTPTTTHKDASGSNTTFGEGLSTAAYAASLVGFPNVPPSIAVGNFHKLLNRLTECLLASQSRAARGAILEAISAYLATCSTFLEDAVAAAIEDLLTDCDAVMKKRGAATGSALSSGGEGDAEKDEDTTQERDEAALSRVWSELSHETSRLLLPAQWLADTLRLLPEMALMFAYDTHSALQQAKLEDANTNASTFATATNAGTSAPKSLTAAGLRGSTTLSGTFLGSTGALPVNRDTDVILPMLIAAALRNSVSFQNLTSQPIAASYTNESGLSEIAFSCMDVLLLEAPEAMALDSAVAGGAAVPLLLGGASAAQAHQDHASSMSSPAVLATHSSRLYNNKAALGQGSTPHIGPADGSGQYLVGSPSMGAFSPSQKQLASSKPCRQLHPFLANVLRGAVTTASGQQRAASATTVLLWEHVVKHHLDVDYQDEDVLNDCEDPLDAADVPVEFRDEDPYLYFDEPPALLPVLLTKPQMQLSMSKPPAPVLSPLTSAGHKASAPMAIATSSSATVPTSSCPNKNSASATSLNAAIALLDPMFSTLDDSSRIAVSEALFPQIIKTAFAEYDKKIRTLADRLGDIRLYGTVIDDGDENAEAEEPRKAPIAALLTEVVEFLGATESTDISLMQAALGGPKLFNALAANANHRISSLSQALSSAGDKRVSAQIGWEAPLLAWKRWLLLPYICQSLVKRHENLHAIVTSFASELKKLRAGGALGSSPKRGEDDIAESELLAFESIKKVLSQHHSFGSNVILPLPLNLLKFVDKHWQHMPTIRQIKESLAAAWIVADGTALLDLTVAGCCDEPTLLQGSPSLAASSHSPYKKSPSSPGRRQSHTRPAGFADLLYQFDTKGNAPERRGGAASPSSPFAAAAKNSLQMLQMISGIASFMTVQCSPSCAVRIVNAAEALLQSTNIAANRYSAQQQLFQDDSPHATPNDTHLSSAVLGEGIVSHQRLLNTLYQISAHLASTSPPGHLVSFFPLILKTFQALSVSAELAEVATSSGRRSNSKKNTRNKAAPIEDKVGSIRGFNLDASVTMEKASTQADEQQAASASDSDADEEATENAIRQCTIHAESMKALRHLLHHLSFRVPELPNEWLSGNALLQCVACYLASTAPPAILTLREEQLQRLSDKSQRKARAASAETKRAGKIEGLNDDHGGEADYEFGDGYNSELDEGEKGSRIPEIPAALIAKCNAEAALTVSTAEAFLKTMAQHFSSPSVGEHTAVIMTLLHHLPTKKVSSMLHIDAAADTADTLSFCERRSNHIAVLPSVPPYSIAAVLSEPMARKVMADGSVPDEDSHTLAATSVSSFSEQTDLCITISFEVADTVDDGHVPELVAGVIQLYSTSPGITASAVPSSPTRATGFNYPPARGVGAQVAPSATLTPASIFLSIPLCGNKVRLTSTVDGTTVTRIQLTAPITTVVRVSDSRPITLAGNFIGADGKEVPLCIRTRAQQNQRAMAHRPSRVSIAQGLLQSPAASPHPTPKVASRIEGSPGLSSESSNALAVENRRQNKINSAASPSPMNSANVAAATSPFATLTLEPSRYIFGVSKGAPLPNTVQHLNDLNHSTQREITAARAIALQHALHCRWAFHAMRSISYRNAGNDKSLTSPSSPQQGGEGVIEAQTYFMYLCPGDVVAVQIVPIAPKVLVCQMATDYLEGIAGYISSDDDGPEPSPADKARQGPQLPGATVQVMCSKSYLLGIADSILNEFSAEV